MNQTREFEGKSLDAAIQAACDYYGLPREKLEIEILSDAKTGIFGLVGMKKASIRAGKTQLPGKSPGPLGEAVDTPAPQGRQRTEKKIPNASPSGEIASGAKNGPEDTSGDGNSGSGRDDRSAQRGRAPQVAGQAPQVAGQAVTKTSLPSDKSGDSDKDELPEIALESFDRETLFALVEETVLKLIEPIVGPVPCRIDISGKRIRATLDCGEAAGLLVGREGQTLAAIQHIAVRIVSRKLGGAVRLHIDAGRYRERQDDKLKATALFWAAKAKETGFPQSTRALSAYQRRIVHLALEADQGVITRSKGEGAQRKVVIYPNSGAGQEKNARAKAAPEPDTGETAGQTVFYTASHSELGGLDSEDNFEKR